MITIVGGKHRGAKLYSPKDKEFRPTLGKTRDAIFNVLSSRYYLDEFIVIDLFAGSGALGLEALSRGATQAFFVEKSHQSLQVLNKNINKLNLREKCGVFKGNALSWIDTFNFSQNNYLFLLDPPYESELINDALKKLEEKHVLFKKSLFILETMKSIELNIPDRFELFQKKQYGSTAVYFLTLENRKEP